MDEQVLPKSAPQFLELARGGIPLTPLLTENVASF